MRPPRSLYAFGLVLLACLAGAASASAASVAYTDQGSVWLSSLDGSQKVKLAAPHVNAAGETEPYIDVAQADSGRIVAARNVAGRTSRFSSFRVWEPDGSSTVQGSLNAPPGFLTYSYPLGFDITASGDFLVYGYGNSTICCPQSFDQGTYVRAANNLPVDPVVVQKTAPSLLGDRMIALEDSFSPTRVDVQDADAGNPFTSAFSPWLDTSGVGLEIDDVDIAATDRLIALSFEGEEGGQTVGKIAVIATQGVSQPVAFPATVDCFLPASGVAGEPSLSPDAASVAWKDDQGVKVAGVPTTAADPCVLSRPAVTLSPTGRYPSIGGADIRAFLPPVTTPPPGGGTPVTGPSTSGSGAPGTRPSSPGSGAPKAPAGTTGSAAVAATALTLRLRARLTAKAVASRAGVPVDVGVPRAGVVSVRVTVPAKRLRKRGSPVLLAAGKGTAKAAGALRVRVRGTARARRSLRRLRGATVTVKVTQSGTSSSRKVTLR